VVIRDQQGNERTLGIAGTPWSISWSPNSRWLAYGEGYKGDGQRMATVVVDTQTWEEHIVGYRLPCSCDAPNDVRWSPSGRYLFYPYDEAGGSRVLSTGDWQTVMMTSSAWWAPDEDVLYRAEQVTQEPPVYSFVRHDIETGASKELLRERFHPSLQAMSPDGRRFAVPESAQGRNDSAFRIIDSAGNVLLDGIAGGFEAWSADGRYIVAAMPSSCGRGKALLDASTGQELGCLQDGSMFGFRTREAFSPTAPVVAYVVSRPVSGQVIGPRTPLTSDVFVLDLVSGQERRVLTDVRGQMHCVEWSPDGRWLIVDDWCDGI
jgi:Tol biopolymer transport system component